MINDKIKHFIAGLVVALFIAVPVYCESGSLFVGIWSALFSAAGAGGAKEFADNQHGCPFDLHDFVWTVAGGVAVALLCLLMHVSKG